MKREEKLKIINEFFNKNKKFHNSINCMGVFLEHTPLSDRYLVKWKFNTYQILTKSELFKAYLTKTFYKDDENQIDNLFKILPIDF